MTPEDLAKLSPEEKRVKIALVCGLKPVPGNWNGPGPYAAADGKVITLPEYLNDLNAMHAVIRCMSNQIVFAYSRHLELIVEGQRGDTLASCLTEEATAAQRADAILLALP